MSSPTQQSSVRVTTGFRPLAFMLYLSKTRLVVDHGEPVVRAWGETLIPVSPGRHTVECWFRYLYFSKAGKSRVTVDVAPGEVVSVRYRAPMFMFSPGKWKVTGGGPNGGPPSTAPAPDWYPDPAQRHQLRYWDGQIWTEHVSDNEVRATDPM